MRISALAGASRSTVRQRTVLIGRRISAPRRPPSLTSAGSGIAQMNGMEGSTPSARAKGIGLPMSAHILDTIPDVLLGCNEAGHALSVDQHHAGNRPVGPRAVRGPRDNTAECVEIAAAVAVVQQRDRNASEVDIVAGRDILEARRTVDDLGVDRRRSPGLVMTRWLRCRVRAGLRARAGHRRSLWRR